MELNEELVFSILNSEDEFPVDLDDAWKWIGYESKRPAVTALRSPKMRFEEGIDFLSSSTKNSQRGRPREKFFLTVDCFKHLAMRAETEKGYQVRRYFVTCEKKLKELLRAEKSRSAEDRGKALISKMAMEEICSRYPKFSHEFYSMLYRKRGGKWAKRDPKSPKRPPIVGKWTVNFVYDLLLGGKEPEGVKSRLYAYTPKDCNGQLKHRLHWHLATLGEFHLMQHLDKLRVIDAVVPDGDWERFCRAVERAFPSNKPYQTNLLDLLEETDRYFLDQA